MTRYPLVHVIEKLLKAIQACSHRGAKLDHASHQTRINAEHFRPKSRAITPPKSVFSSYMPSLCAVKVKQRNAILAPIMQMRFLGF
ncbi:MAG: hypothetical protein LBL45_04960 [Treponema sp.]|jgi:hypothetical protein|nr:hypothetical protein [Treponema sp.]